MGAYSRKERSKSSHVVDWGFSWPRPDVTSCRTETNHFGVSTAPRGIPSQSYNQWGYRRCPRCGCDIVRRSTTSNSVFKVGQRDFHKDCFFWLLRVRTKKACNKYHQLSRPIISLKCKFLSERNISIPLSIWWVHQIIIG